MVSSTICGCSRGIYPLCLPSVHVRAGNLLRGEAAECQPAENLMRMVVDQCGILVQSSLFGDVIPEVLPTSWLSKCAVRHNVVAWLATALGSLLKFASASCVPTTVGSWHRKICLHKNKNVSCRAAEVFLPLTVMVCGRLDQRKLGSKVALRDLSPAAQKFVTAAFLTNQICHLLEHSR